MQQRDREGNGRPATNRGDTERTAYRNDGKSDFRKRIIRFCPFDNAVLEKVTVEGLPKLRNATVTRSADEERQTRRRTAANRDTESS